MKKASVFLSCLAAGIYLFSCSKSGSHAGSAGGGSNDLPQSVANSLNNVDSLHQFAQIFGSLSLNADDASGGVTVLAVTDNSLVNPIDPDDLKDYIIQGEVAPSDLTNGKVLTSITGKKITITVQNGNTYANGVMISVTPVVTATNYSIYALAGLYVSGPPRYTDPHINEYYIEYEQNGEAHSLNGRSVTSWTFVSSDHYPTPVAGNCSYPTYTSYSSGPAQALVAFAADNPFWLQINRNDLTSPPKTGDYRLSATTYNAGKSSNTGNCNLVIAGAVFGCDLGDKDAYVHVNISEVKVDQDLGLEKRGYYTGTFDAILYHTGAGGTTEKLVITNGRFKAPMGNNETAPLNGTAPVVDWLSILTTGKWYWKPTVEAANAIDPTSFPACNLDDYIVFRANGTCDFKQGANVCPEDINEIDHGDNIPWSLTDKTNINFTGTGTSWQIISLVDSILTVGEVDGGDAAGGFYLQHGN